jgi:hypothetical protein
LAIVSVYPGRVPRELYQHPSNEVVGYLGAGGRGVDCGTNHGVWGVWQFGRLTKHWA